MSLLGRRWTLPLVAMFAAALAATVLYAGAASPSAQGATTTPLRITDVSPDGGTNSVPSNTSIVVVFDGQADVDSAFRSFKVKKAGSKKAISGTYVFATNLLKLFPSAPLEPNTTYKATVKGGKKGVRSADGGTLDGVDDPSATFKNGNVSWTFTTKEA